MTRVVLSLFWMVTDVTLQLKLSDDEEPGIDTFRGSSP